jgi:exodeoxyribonuclease VII small subunit
MAKSTPSKTTEPALPQTYELALQELERLITDLESGQLPLDQLLISYQRGAQLMAFCKTRLEAVENQIRVLDGTELKNWSGAK